jgi:hypothetical protein
VQVYSSSRYFKSLPLSHSDQRPTICSLPDVIYPCVGALSHMIVVASFMASCDFRVSTIYAPCRGAGVELPRNIRYKWAVHPIYFPIQSVHTQETQDTLIFKGTIEHLEDPKHFRRFITALRAKKWVLYAKEPFDGPQHAFTYVSRYTHRVAISNSRLVDLSDGNVTFKARDNANPGKHQLLTLSAHEFIRRFLIHVLPKGFVRIRHYGLLAPCDAKTKLQTARQLILQMDPESPHYQPLPKHHVLSNKPWQQLMKELTGVDPHICPKCGKATLLRISLNPLTCLSLSIEGPVPVLDSS